MKSGMNTAPIFIRALMRNSIENLSFRQAKACKQIFPGQNILDKPFLRILNFNV